MSHGLDSEDEVDGMNKADEGREALLIAQREDSAEKAKR
jgi:hypothetical protein